MNTPLSTEQKLREALQFCLDMAEEEYPYQAENAGAELVLRHIARRCRDALSALDVSK